MYRVILWLPPNKEFIVPSRLPYFWSFICIPGMGGLDNL